MTTDIKKLVERLRVAEVREAFQTDGGSPELQMTELGLDAADALEAMAGEVETLTRRLDDALKGDVLQMMRAQTNRAEAAETERDRLKAALEDIDAVAVDFGYYEAAARTMKELARKAREGDA